MKSNSQTSKHRWLPQFSLRTFLLCCLLGGGGVAWLSHNYSQYRVEKRLIRSLTTRLPRESMLTVATNGETTFRVGSMEARLMWEPDSISVVVDYRGPEAIRSLVEAMEIPIFNRVSQIKFLYRDLSKIRIDKENMARLQELERITIAKRRKPVNEYEVAAVGDIVPPCRLASVDKTKNQIDFKVKPGTALACCSP